MSAKLVYPAVKFGIKGTTIVRLDDDMVWRPATPAQRYACRLRWSKDTRWVAAHCKVLFP